MPELFGPNAPRPDGRGASFRPLVDRRKKPKPQLSIRDGSWEGNALILSDAIDAGLGVLLARTQDGGAISMTVYQGQSRYRSYASSEEELDELFTALAANMRGA